MFFLSDLYIYLKSYQKTYLIPNLSKRATSAGFLYIVITQSGFMFSIAYKAKEHASKLAR